MNIFFIILLVILLVLIVGVMKPSLVLPFLKTEKQNKKNVFAFYFSLSLFIFIIFIIYSWNSVMSDINKDIDESTMRLTSNKSSGQLITTSSQIVKEEGKDLQLNIVPPIYTFQKPTEFTTGTPERALAEYVNAWKNQDWQTMKSFVQKTWLSNEKDAVGVLEAWYDFKDLKGFEITQVKTSPVSADITFIVQYEMFSNEIIKKKITAKIIKEIAAYTPSERGQWGINPTSTLDEKDVN